MKTVEKEYQINFFKGNLENFNLDKRINRPEKEQFL